jgi:hypothetical protein
VTYEHFFENPVSQERTIRFGWNFQDILKTIRALYGPNFIRKFLSFKFSVQDMPKNRAKNQSSSGGQAVPL